MQIYLIGSLRNEEVPVTAAKLRTFGFDVFDQWYSAGPNADDHLRDHFTAMGMSHAQILQTAAAKNIFEFDKKHIQQSDAVVLLMPAGKSGFLELGWAVGQGKPGFILFDKDPERVDVMFQFADAICYSIQELVGKLNAQGIQLASQKCPIGRDLRGASHEMGKSLGDQLRSGQGDSDSEVSELVDSADYWGV
jgi:hypothetical protein